MDPALKAFIVFVGGVLLVLLVVVFHECADWRWFLKKLVQVRRRRRIKLLIRTHAGNPRAEVVARLKQLRVK